MTGSLRRVLPMIQLSPPLKVPQINRQASPFRAPPAARASFPIVALGAVSGS